ncbi:CYTH and CHAD domain-containing protein [Amycolatopsis acidiphila]|uniref:CYTH and CHAD domain-containing protein n=1 Tax=Amycolatopsis acidiphila TaxID=715473 RepID=A0A558ACL5_9PSEU|nr:CYTH and CHAD domain-containing protein [Amycolatopsis acidiphila]TVT22011.1 CYTH and CHAD domain-containing protein [Amycolatopsis acidiphila]UIJ63673.1 CYTH and CHAD domain-containing protein [Amycolatopsis acidiphila]GHG67539.1 CHAD domain-containing protein [Amycolatopsis acidiphila]
MNSPTPMTVVERERKFDLDADQPVPRLDGVGPVAAQREPVETTLHATYFDTPGYRLARARTTLRRRTGGGDEGWHLKRPVADEAREEVHLPLDSGTDTVPEGLRELVESVLGGEELAPVVHLKTVRRSHDLVNAEGAVLATLTDDQVSGETAGDVLHLDGWRELEVELAPSADPALLGTLGDALVAAGARPGHWPSKLRRLLGDRVPSDEEAPGRRSNAGDVVVAYLRGQLAAVREHDLGVRRDDEDSVHQLRVAMRRMRSALTVFRHVLDRAATRGVSAELKWAAGELSPARDTEVLHAYLAERLAGLPAEALVGDAAARLDAHFEQQATEARARAREALKGGRYAALIGSLEQLLAEPPLTARAAEPAKAELGRAIERAHRKLSRAVERLGELEPGPDLDAGLHEVRKKAKRARYGAEAVEPVAGKGLRRWQQSVKAVQRTLGGHHDSVVAREVLRDLGGTPGAFSYGVLYDRELGRAAALHQRFTEQWREVSPP